MLKLQGTQEQVIGIKVGSGLLLHPLNLGELYLRLNRRHYAFRNTILKAEDVVHFTFETIGPDVCAGRRVD
jgi:hypothetical protein